MKYSALLKCTASAFAIIIASSGAAFAQSASPQPPSDESLATNDQTIGEIVVAGSRVATGEDAPTPVTVVTPEAINQVALPNVADALVQIPALRASTTSSKGGQGTSVGSSLNLRALGSFRTLVLVDGQRFVTTPSFGGGQGQAVNIDAIPQGLIKRVETVTGGASAAYGSDAVAGVVNFVLDHTFEGIKGEGSYGQTSRSDGIRYNGNIAAGGAFGDGKGHIIMSAEYARDEGIGNDPVGGNPVRPWQSAEQTIGREARGTSFVLVPNAREWQVPLNSLVVGCIDRDAVSATNPTGQLYDTCALYLTSFNDAGTATQTYNTGNRATATRSGVFAEGGDGYQPGGQSVLNTPSTRYSVFTRVGYDITPKLSVYFSALQASTKSYSQVGSGTPGLINTAALGVPILADYAYLPANLQAAMVSNNISSINIQKTFNVTGQQIFDARTTRVVAGGDYQFNDNWSADFYYEYGKTDDSLQLNRFVNSIAYKNAVDAVIGPNGQPICRSTLTDPNNGCVPYNIFGREMMTAAQQAYITPSNNYFINNSQQVFEATIKGSPFSLPAGALDIAAGTGYRKETLANSTDTLGLAARRNPYNGNPGASIYLNQPAVNGTLDLWEVFGEAQVPLLKDFTFAKSLELNLAARYTDYSSSGGVTTWKAGAVWVPVEGLRFRLAQSRDIRAANLVELNSPDSSGFASVRDPTRPGSSNVSIIPITSGNPNLTPEEADTTTIGVVLNPTFWPSVYASVDFFNIKISKQISTINSQRTLDLCALGLTEYCARITRNAGGDITTIRTPYVNLASAKNEGIDVELGYTHDLFGGRFAARLFGTYIFENSTTTPGNPPSVLDSAPLAARLQGLLTADYVTGPWTFALQEHYVGGGRFSVQDARYPGDEAPSQVWTDLAIKRKMGDTWELYGSVINLFDKDPPHYPFTAPSSGSGTSTLFDTQGRRFQIGARFRL